MELRVGSVAKSAYWFPKGSEFRFPTLGSSQYLQAQLRGSSLLSQPPQAPALTYTYPHYCFEILILLHTKSTCIRFCIL